MTARARRGGGTATPPHVRIYDGLYNTIAFRTLDGGALKLWIDLRIQWRGSNNGSLIASLSVLRHRGLDVESEA